MIRLENVSKTYSSSGVKALDDINLEIRDGEIFGFLGPNGAGKTTAIKIITGIINPDAGHAFVDKYDVKEEPLAAKRNIGYVTDNPDIFAKLRAKEYLNFIGDVFRVPGRERQEIIQDLAAKFEIKDVLNASIGSYSHGMKQKLLVTGSLLSDPQNWILDEPMIGLDPRSAFIMKELMRQRADRGRAVFFSTHVMEVAEKICDRLAIINKGKILFIGTLKELKDFRGKEASLEEMFLSLTDVEVFSEFENGREQAAGKKPGKTKSGGGRK